MRARTDDPTPDFSLSLAPAGQSTGTFLAPAYDSVIAEIEHRIAELTMLPIENQEAMQVLHYGIGEKYGAHMARCPHAFAPRLLASGACNLRHLHESASEIFISPCPPAAPLSRRTPSSTRGSRAPRLAASASRRS